MQSVSSTLKKPEPGCKRRRMKAQAAKICSGPGHSTLPCPMPPLCDAFPQISEVDTMKQSAQANMEPPDAHRPPQLPCVLLIGVNNGRMRETGGFISHTIGPERSFEQKCSDRTRDGARLVAIPETTVLPNDPRAFSLPIPAFLRLVASYTRFSSDKILKPAGGGQAPHPGQRQTRETCRLDDAKLSSSGASGPEGVFAPLQPQSYLDSGYAIERSPIAEGEAANDPANKVTAACQSRNPPSYDSTGRCIA
jgi:hypothetical protein